MKAIDPKKIYTLQEIVENKILAGVTRYTVMYNLVTRRDEIMKKKVLHDTTTKYGIKGTYEQLPWNKIPSRILVAGEELIKFLNLIKQN